MLYNKANQKLKTIISNVTTVTFTGEMTFGLNENFIPPKDITTIAKFYMIKSKKT